MRREQNGSTQPFKTQPVFNNWDVVNEGWYFLGKSKTIKVGAIEPFELCGQRVVVFRGADGRLRALDAFCPHMGTDLAIGKVVDNDIRCFFHHWSFNGDGECTDIPCGATVPKKAKLQSYDVRERYGLIWIWPGAEAAHEVPCYPELEDEEVYAICGRSYIRNCHPTVNMINGLDAQHLKTVHNISIDMELQTQEASDGRIIDFQMTGPLPQENAAHRLMSKMMGGSYAYSMRYVDATVGLLRTMEKVKWFGKFEAEPTRMMFAYTPLSKGQTRVQPIFIARKPASILGRLKSYSLLLAMTFGFLWLRDEDGKVYDNIRFQPNALLKIDKGVARFVQYVNRLKLSPWSTTHQYRGPSRGLVSLPGPSTAKEPGAVVREIQEDVG